MLIKLDDAIAAVKAIEVPVGGFEDKIDAWLKAIDISAAALRALPVSDGWEDIATYEGPGDEYLQVWCECEDSGMRWTTVAYRTCYELWFNDLDGYVPAKGYRPLPAPPTIE